MKKKRGLTLDVNQLVDDVATYAKGHYKAEKDALERMVDRLIAKNTELLAKVTDLEEMLQQRREKDGSSGKDQNAR